MIGAKPSPDFWRGKRVVLTGHTGFKGAWAALWLTRMGAKVTGLALPPEPGPSLFEMAGVSACTDSNYVDIRDADEVKARILNANPQIVIHMAAQALVRRSYRESSSTFATNIMGTVNVLEASRSAPDLKAVLIVTSDKVYENDGQGAAFVEGDKLGGHDPYSASKAAAEIVAASYRSSFFSNGHARIATARGGNVIGGGDYSEDRIVPDIVRAYMQGKPAVLRHPEATRPWQHVLDCLAGYFVFTEALAEGRSADAALNFGPSGSNSLPVKELAAAMQAAMGAAQGWARAQGESPVEMSALALDSGQAARKLGWISRLDSEEAINWTAAWYKSTSEGMPILNATLSQISEFSERS